MEKYNYILGLDLGTGSVGWSCVLVDEKGEPYRILDLGSRIFEPEGSSMEDRRVARGLRRVLRRRKGRVNKVKQLFIKNSFLSDAQINNIFNSKGVQKKDPYLLKLKGKEELLDYEELCTILVHYAKGRGFKSNRKALEVGKESKSASEDQKLLFAKQKTEEFIKEKQKENSSYTITNLLLEKFEENSRIKNTSGAYLVGITRAMIEEEITMILDKQCELDLINQNFINEIKGIIFHQRLFSEGPDEPSPYHNPLQQMIGKCKFTGESRASKSSLSYELFTLVQKLRDVRFYSVEDGEKKKLSSHEIEQLIQLAKQGKTINYGQIRKVLQEEVKFVGLSITIDAYRDIVKRLKDDDTLNKDDEILKEKNKITIFELKKYNDLRKKVAKAFGKDYELEDQQYDLIADCLTRCKSDIEIQAYLNGQRDVLRDVEVSEELNEFVKTLDDQGYKAFGKVSFEFLHKILPLMIDENMDYAEACTSLFGNHTNTKVNDEDFDNIPVIENLLSDLDQSINNKSVIRTLVESRKVVNAIINKYGKPQAIHVEMARELTKSSDERQEIQRKQFQNQTMNMGLKYQIYSKHPEKFRGVDDIKNQDLIQYKLFIEQRGICPYTLLKTGNEMLARIHEKDLFTASLEIDHIIPYSICYDDRMENKVLVKREENQEKSNKTPLQYYVHGSGKAKYISWVKTNPSISEQKQDRFLADKVTDQLLNDYRARTINDTRYAAKAFKQILNYSFPSVKVRSFTGQVTAKLRGVYRLNGLTHSLEAKNYKVHELDSIELEKLYMELSEMIERGVSRRSKEFFEQCNKIDKMLKADDAKNRDNHLHHALDATIIAIATDKVRRKVEMHEMALRQKKKEELRFAIQIIDDETGELSGFEEKSLTIEEYKKQIENTASLENAIFPQPYEHFKEELIYRTYEQNPNVLREKLSKLNNYADINLNSISPIFVSHHYASKISGRLHKATFYGVKEVDKKQKLTERTSIASKEFNNNKLEKMFDTKESQSYVYEAVKDWLGSFPNGLEAFESHKDYPYNRNGNPIKKVKLDVGELKEEIQIQEGIKQFVRKDDVVQVRIYKKENDDKLYFSGFDRFRVINENRRKDLNILLWCGQGKKISIKSSELKSNGFVEKPQCLLKGQTVYIEKNDGTCGIVKVVGFTKGRFEVESIIGDGFDLIDKKLFAKIDRFRFTVSTIKSVKPISISILGEIKSKL